MRFKSESGVAGQMIAMLVLVILGAATAIPVIQSAIENAGVTGNTATILSLIPLFVALLLLLAFAKPLLRRLR